MRFEGRRQAQLFDRCWSIYLWLTHAFSLPESFHVEFPVAVESTLITGTLHLLRADNLPHHRADYRGRALIHPPHHMHDERGRVRSFTWQVQDFISAAKSFLTLP